MKLKNLYHLYTVREDLTIITRVAYLRSKIKAATRMKTKQEKNYIVVASWKINYVAIMSDFHRSNISHLLCLSE